MITSFYEDFSDFIARRAVVSVSTLSDVTDKKRGLGYAYECCSRNAFCIPITIKTV